MTKQLVGAFVAVLFCAALAFEQGAQNSKQGADQSRFNRNPTFSSYDIQATNAFLGTDWFWTGPQPAIPYNTHIHMSNGQITLHGGDAAQAPQTSSWPVGPDVQLQPYQGTAAWGHFTILNYGDGPAADVAYCTGLNNTGGFQNGCDIANNSSDSVGEIWLTGGPTGTSSSGTMQVVFGGTPWPATPYCQLTLKDEHAAWAQGATVKEIAPLGGRSPLEAFTVAWDNNGANMPDGFGGPGVGIQYFCVAAP